MPYPQILQIIIDEIHAMTRNGGAPPELAGKSLNAETPITDLMLDSLGKLSLLSAVEDRADVMLGEGDIKNAKTLGDLAEAVAALI